MAKDKIDSERRRKLHAAIHQLSKPPYADPLK
jgi:hypothetical protein